MSKIVDLCISIPTWNSQLFLPHCLEALKQNSKGITYTVNVLDNNSVDDSQIIAYQHGCKVQKKTCSLPDALNLLVKASNAEYTLFIHPDTILLNTDWFSLCTRHLKGNTVLVSPQDTGCGPYSRPWGAGKPESSFMLFKTKELKKLRRIRWVRHYRLPWPQPVVNFFSPSVTHYIPDELARVRQTWFPMKVLTSRKMSEPVWEPDATQKALIHWSEELAYLEYGLGNFYSLDETIIHYQNWYERLIDRHKADISIAGDGIPLDYIANRTNNFLTDLKAGQIGLPDPLLPERHPTSIALWTI